MSSPKILSFLPLYLYHPAIFKICIFTLRVNIFNLQNILPRKKPSHKTEDHIYDFNTASSRFLASSCRCSFRIIYLSGLFPIPKDKKVRLILSTLPLTKASLAETRIHVNFDIWRVDISLTTSITLHYCKIIFISTELF